MAHIIFDVESTELHGVGFAVGVVLMDDLMQIQEAKGWKTFNLGGHSVCDFVQENVLPVLAEDLQMEIMPSMGCMRSAFWDYYVSVNEDAVRKGETLSVWGDVVWPVEANFLRECVQDVGARAKQAPFPLLDIATKLYPEDPERLRFVDGTLEMRPHHPIDDAYASACALRYVLKSEHVTSN